jgi:hypothetical protein
MGKAGSTAAGKPQVAVGTMPLPTKKGPPSGASKTTSTGTKAEKKAPAPTPSKKKAAAAVVKTPKTPSKTPAPAKTTATVAESAPPEKKPAARPAGANGRRDPFVSVIRNIGPAAAPGSGCSTGKRCLSIPELVLQGTVKDISGKMMAVVVNSAHRTYTLRENDQVFNGSVEKITTDSIVFREFTKDALGRESAREVVKKISPTS